MTSQPNNAHTLIAWNDTLVCPACHGELSLHADRIVCRECGSAYPLVDGIPVLIGERSISGKDIPS